MSGYTQSENVIEIEIVDIYTPLLSKKILRMVV